MILYHTTDAADQILRGGFRDAAGSYMFVDFELTGVFLARRNASHPPRSTSLPASSAPPQSPSAVDAR
jgi:hypothetical protein